MELINILIYLVFGWYFLAEYEVMVVSAVCPGWTLRPGNWSPPAVSQGDLRKLERHPPTNATDRL